MRILSEDDLRAEVASLIGRLIGESDHSVDPASMARRLQAAIAEQETERRGGFPDGDDSHDLESRLYSALLEAADGTLSTMRRLGGVPSGGGKAQAEGLPQSGDLTRSVASLIASMARSLTPAKREFTSEPESGQDASRRRFRGPDSRFEYGPVDGSRIAPRSRAAVPGPVSRGPVSRGPVARGPVARGPVTIRPADADDMAAIMKLEIEPAFQPFCRRYAGVGHRDGFLWRWVQRGLELTTLPTVDLEFRSTNRTAKLLGVMLDVLLDDVADNLQDPVFLEILLHIPLSKRRAPPGQLAPDRRKYLRFTGDVWTEIWRLACTFPRFAEFEEIFEFDYRQLLNTMRYACLVNRVPELLNSVEHDLYQPHNMHMMISGTLDLMCSPTFDVSELGPLRQALWHGQVMGRIGNMLSTWERELHERDFTSGVFAEVIDRGVVEAGDLARMPTAELAILIEGSGVIEYFLEMWERLRAQVRGIADTVRSVDLRVYADGLEELIRLHLGSRGMK